MKNLNSLLARLSTISLAAAMFFSAAQAATTARKDPRAAAAVIEALVHQATSKDVEVQVAKTLTENAGASNLYDIHDKNLVVGSLSSPRKAVVFGDVRASGDVIAGQLAATSKDAAGYKLGTGLKHLIGVTELNPRTQQLAISFKDKTAACHGAFVDLDFVTTATSDHLTGITKDNGVVTSAVRAHDIYCHPQMLAQQIMGQVGAVGQNLGSRMDMRASTTSWTVNAKNRATEVIDFRLTPTVRVEAITKDVCFGFVPYSRTYPVTDNSGYGFYESGWKRSNYSAGIPVWETGTLAYKVAGKEVGSVLVVTEISDTLQTLDVFDLFTDEELAALLESLKEYFGEDSTKIREYLMANRHQLSRAFKALR